MTVRLPYAGSSLAFEVPDEQLECVIEPNEVDPPESPAEVVRSAIRAPIGAPPLPELVGPRDRICVIVDDISRPTPTEIVVPVLLEELHAAGVPAEQVRIVFGLGSHRPMNRREMQRKLGAGILERYEVANSEFRDRTKMRYLGEAEPGAEIWLDRRVVECDARIAVGNIVPHGAVGWSGGAKMIYPGVASADTVANYHMKSGLIRENLLGRREPGSRTEMERWVDHVGLEFILNTILTRDRRIYRAVAGHFVAAHRAGIRYAEEVYAVKVGTRVDIAVVSAHPAEADFWQAGKGILSGEMMLKDGGTLVLVAPCPEGVGPHPRFPEYVGCDDAEERLSGMVGKVGTLGPGEDPLALAVAVILVRIRRRVRVVVVSPGLDEATVRRCGFAAADSVERALAGALVKHGAQARVAVLTHGGETLPRA